MPTKKTKITKDTLVFQNDAQEQLMRVVLSKFKEYDDRKQHYYSYEGMSTSHITLKAIEDLVTLHAFWPLELQRRQPYGGTIYQLEDHTITKVQSNIRKELESLEKKGYLLKVGNENERRWLPAKELRWETL